MYAVNGVLFNHESPRRGETFVTRKITRAAARIKAGLQHKLYLGNLDAVRDWGYAPEYVEGMWRMLQADAPSDYVLATGVGASVREFADTAFAALDLIWSDHVQVDEQYLRPSEVEALVGDASYANATLGWKAQTTWKPLAELMAMADWSRWKPTCRGCGFASTGSQAPTAPAALRSNAHGCANGRPVDWGPPPRLARPCGWRTTAPLHGIQFE